MDALGDSVRQILAQAIGLQVIGNRGTSAAFLAILIAVAVEMPRTNQRPFGDPLLGW